MSFAPLRVGVIGVGDISTVYLNAIQRSPALDLAGLAAQHADRAEAAGAARGVRGGSVDALLADDAVELILNLTPATAHEQLNAAAIAAGKHLYSEKPFAFSRAASTELAEAAGKKGVLIGSAPDTFYGSAHQATRAALDGGAIGKPVFATSFVGLPGLELFHPNPAQFYRAGGEPPYDGGPYYLAQFINLFGPVRRVYAAGGAGLAERTIQRGPNAGTSFAVEVPSSFNCLLEFDAATLTLTISLDVVKPIIMPGQIFGSEGILTLPSPLFFTGDPSLFRPAEGDTPIDFAGQPFAEANRRDHFGNPVGDYRGVGLIDLAIAIRTGKPHRTGSDWIIHLGEVMEAIVASARDHKAVALASSCARPAPIDAVADAQLIALTASPFDLDHGATHAAQ